MARKFNSDWIGRNVHYKRLPDRDGLAAYGQQERRVIVCLCGSTRFWKEYQEANYRETMAGKIVLSVGFYPGVIDRRMIQDGCMGEQEVIVPVAMAPKRVSGADKKALDELHLDKIDLADEVLILNVGGYVGESTQREVLHAKSKFKTIRWLEPDNIPETLRHCQ